MVMVNRGAKDVYAAFNGANVMCWPISIAVYLLALDAPGLVN